MKRFQKMGLLVLLFCSLIMHGCRTQDVIGEYVIDDLVDIKQNHESYVNNTNADRVLIPRRYHALLAKQYRQKHLSPWHSVKPFVKKKHVLREFLRLKNNEIFGENKQKVSAAWVKKIEGNANLAKFPNYPKKAITIANTNLRLLPTNKPLFSKFSDHSNGFPFDSIQNSTLPANTPIFVTHITKDNAWVFVETPIAYGWVPIRDIAYAGPKFRKEFKRYTNYVAAIEDDFAVKSMDGVYLYQGYIGMTFPLVRSHKYFYQVITAMASPTRYAYVKRAKVPRKVSVKKPMPLSSKNVAKLCNNLIDQPYGWGGLFNNRDCSAMIKDLFAPFSIWLPRNSASQAKHGGLYIDVSAMDTEQKELFITENAVPYLTLLWFPGHIMLYIGEKDNESLVFHNIWGIRTKDKMKRKIIGKAVITTLNPGKELAEVDKSFNFLSRIKGMTLLTPRY